MGDSIHDDTDPSGDDSSIRTPVLPAADILKIYQTGPVTVVGFGGVDVPDEVCIAAYREQLLQLISDGQCNTLAFDLTGVKLIPSGMLGVLITLKKHVPTIELYNASDDIRHVLELTHLQSMFTFKNVNL